MLKSRDAELLCGSCGAVFAAAHLPPFAGRMSVVNVITGATVQARPGYSVNEEARQRLARAETAVGDQAARDLDDARGVADYLRLHGGEIIYDLACRCRRRFVRSSPGLRREIAKIKGRWVTLSVGTATWGPPPED